MNACSSRANAWQATRTEQFAQFLSRSPELSGRVTVPAVYRRASAARVLTLERLYGTSMTNLDAVRRYSSPVRQQSVHPPPLRPEVPTDTT